jgi:hypothetical protein
MPINKLTTLLDLSRQSKILSGETATFDGKILSGIPFSGYPSGVDTSTAVSLGIASSETAVFSGDTGTTVFDVSNISSPNYNIFFSDLSGTTWSNPIFSANTSGLTLPILPISAETQIVGPFWVLTQTGMTGDYIIDTQYTGFSVTYSFDSVSQIGSGFTYSGFTTATQENFSAGTLDYKGPLDYLSSKEDASVDGRLTTNKITIKNGASASTIGYVLTQTGENGEGEWLPNSSADTNTFVTGGTYFNGVATFINNSGGTFNVSGFTQPFSGGSGNCISDLFVSKIHSCSPLNINPNDEGNVYFGSTSGVTIDVINSRIGIGINSPTEKLDVSGKTKTINFQMTSGGTNGYVLTSDASGNAIWQPSSGGVPSSTTANTTTINFTGQTIYYDASTSGSGNITEDLSNAKLGLIQKIYHMDVSEPTYPAGWVLLGDAIYFTSTLNIIYAEWAGGSRVEYWYVQEQ